MNIKKILWTTICVCLFIMIPTSLTVYAKELPSNQQDMADKIAQICIENYEEYGVLPSVCVGQAFIESTLGEHCRGYNLWGIQSGKEQYSSLEEGIIRYLNVINNGYYKGAPFQTDYHTQIKIILDGGYCVPAGSYYEKIIWSIDNYNFSKYDTQLFEYLDAKEKEKQAEIQRQEEEQRRLEEEQKKIEISYKKIKEKQEEILQTAKLENIYYKTYLIRHPDIVRRLYITNKSKPIASLNTFISNDLIYTENKKYLLPRIKLKE